MMTTPKRGAKPGNQHAKLANPRNAKLQANLTTVQYAALTEMATSRNLTVAEMLALIATGGALVLLVPSDNWYDESFIADLRSVADGNEAIEMLAAALDEARGRRD